jgi:hypothetical protein
MDEKSTEKRQCVWLVCPRNAGLVFNFVAFPAFLSIDENGGFPLAMIYGISRRVAGPISRFRLAYDSNLVPTILHIFVQAVFASMSRE